ncbi:MAG TPA: hypothetical protein VGA29_09185 [Ignavibacteriaceae bacterium]
MTTTVATRIEADPLKYLSKEIIDFIKDPTEGKKRRLPSDARFKTKSGEPDYLGTALYHLNSLQEYYYAPDKSDKYGRFPYTESWQFRNAQSQENYVGTYFQQFARSVPELSQLKLPRSASRIFVSHDIDYIHGGLPQIGKALLKRLDFPEMLKVLVSFALHGPPWMDFDRIMKIDDVYDVKATFFWLVNKGRGNSPLNDAEIKNADYDINDPRLTRWFKKIKNRGFEHGLHKSASNIPLKEELGKLPMSVVANRNHYLLIRIPEHYDQIEQAGLKIDCSLGFPTEMGFRNGFSLPFTPYNFQENRPYGFVEVPLNIMDTTFRFHLGIQPSEAKKQIINFLDKHKTNAVISLVWHNISFSEINYPDWLELYKYILAYCRDSGIRSVQQKELLDFYYFCAPD